MPDNLTIGEIAKRADIPTKTIRFYEQVGLIAAAKRSDNGYRVYSSDFVQELALIKFTRNIGLSIPKIKKLMVGCENHDCKHSKKFIEREINEYISILETKLQELEKNKKLLGQLSKNISRMKKMDGKYCCSILGYLTKLPKGGEKL